MTCTCPSLVELRFLGVKTRGLIPFLAILVLEMVTSSTAHGKAMQFETLSNQPSFQVRIPGLGQNPWVLESFFKQNGVTGPDGRDAATQLQLKALKKLLEGQNFPFSSQQKSLLENLIKEPGTSGPGVESLKELAKGLISKADPAQQDFLREKLAGMGKSGGVADLLGSLGKITPPGQPTNQGLPKNPFFSKMIAPPIPDPGGPLGNQSQAPSTPPQPIPVSPSPVGPMNPPRIGDLSRMFARVLPFGLDKTLAPLGKEMFRNAKDVFRGFKIPESWKPGLRNAFKDFTLPNNLGGMTPSLPRAPMGDSISGAKMMLGFVGSFALLILLIWFLPKVIRNGPLSAKPFPVFASSKKGEGFVARLEGLVMKLGGEQLAFGNHMIWKEQCRPLLVALGMAEENVDHVFSVYETAKYSKKDLDWETDERLVEMLKRYV